MYALFISFVSFLKNTVNIVNLVQKRSICTSTSKEEYQVEIFLVGSDYK